MASQVSGYSGTSSAFYQSTIHSTGIQRETLSDRITQTKLWLFNSEEGTIMGRTIFDWVLVIFSTTVFLASLMLVSAGFCGVFYWVVDWNYPTLQGPQGIIQTPGMSFRPQADVRSTLIRFIKGDITTYTHLLDHLESYIQYYENALQQGDRYKDCSAITNRRKDELDKVCFFDPQQLGSFCVKQQNYGFDDGQPCILLKLNRVFEWVPEEYTNETVPDILKDQWITNPDNMWWIFVRCYGDDDASRENMGDLTYFPTPGGFHFKYYPFLNQQGYRSPLMFLRLENPRPGVLLFITCRAFAKNIVHDRTENIGQVRFEVLVD